jgi:hypothetical protein
MRMPRERAAEHRALVGEPWSSRPVPRPTHASIGTSSRRLIRHAADDVFAIPISPKPITFVPSAACWRTRAAPAASAAFASSSVIAGSSAKLRVPRAIGSDTSRSDAGSGDATPASTISSTLCATPANALIAAPPARKFATICAVTDCGYGLTPSAAIPWSAAKTIVTGRCTCGRSVRWISASCNASASSWPRLPGGLVL